MANRFLETNYYKSPFVRGLKGALKSLYSFIICDCTHSGIWAKDLEAAGLYIGFSVSEEEFETFFVKKGKAVSIGRGKFFFPDFIEHQYPSGLSTNNKSHTKTIEELKKLSLLDESKTRSQKDKKNIDFYTYFALSKKGALEGLQSPQGNGNGNKYDKDSIVPKMFKLFKGLNPHYAEEQETDFTACWHLAIKIGIIKNLTQEQVLNGHQEYVLQSWNKISQFIVSDDWFSGRSLSDINKEWQRLIQKMNKKPKDQQQNIISEKIPAHLKSLK